MPTTPDDAELFDLAVRVGDALAARKWTVTTAESCTGGWVARCLTDVAGSSGWFGGAIVTYSDAMKHRHLGVSESVLRRHGAVSEATVRAMAAGARGLMSADVAVAVSGVAGPGGGSALKPVGLVWLAWAAPQGTRAESHRFEGNRESVRRQSVASALMGILTLCEPPRG